MTRLKKNRAGANFDCVSSVAEHVFGRVGEEGERVRGGVHGEQRRHDGRRERPQVGAQRRQQQAEGGRPQGGQHRPAEHLLRVQRQLEAVPPPPEPLLRGRQVALPRAPARPHH